MPQIKESNYLQAKKKKENPNKAFHNQMLIIGEKKKTLKESKENDIWQKNNVNDHRFIRRNHKFHKAATLL